jgi:hypothetical protein
MTMQYGSVPQTEDEIMYVEVNDDYILPTFVRENKLIRYSLFGLCALISLAFLYVMVVLLPSLAPEGVQIPDIPMTKNVDVYLHPIVPEIKKGKQQDPDDPIKIIPDFAHLPYASSKLDSVKTHLKKLTTYHEAEGVDFQSKSMKKRMILIGDVHGCLKQLKKLLARVKYDGGKDDHVILLGDFTNKGPESIELINFAIQNKLDCTLGNHEIAMMKRYTQFHALKAPLFKNEDTGVNSSIGMREVYDLDELMKLAKKLTPEHIDFLSKCSPIKQLGPVPHFYNAKQTKHAEYPANGVAVHAGLVWDKGIHHQDVEEVTTMRNLLPPDWKVPTEDRKDKVGGVKSVAWTKIWNEKQSEHYDETLEKSKKESPLTIATKVFYGHDAKRGVVTKEFSNGLDSGCVYGKQLTGVIIWSQVSRKEHEDEKIVYKQMHVEVNC